MYLYKKYDRRIFISVQKIICFLCAVIGVSITLQGTVNAEAILIVDHSAVQEFDNIPDVWIEQVKTMLIHNVGASHGKQVPHGLELIEAMDSKYSVQTHTDLDSLTETGALRVLRAQRKNIYNQWIEYIGDDRYWSTEDGREWTEDTAQYCIDHGDALFLSMWCWSYHMFNNAYGVFDEDSTKIPFNDERRDAYINALERFIGNSSINSTKFLYLTSVCEANVDSLGWKVTRYNEDIRDLASVNNGILFDQADIENWNIDNTEQSIDTWDGHTLYLRHSDYEESNPPDTYSDDHTNDALCIRKAKATWWMLARMAGWDGTTDSYITVTSPNGGEDWIGRTEHSITWSSNNSINVKIEYSTDNGLNWTVITSSISASSGVYSWTVPNIPSSTCLIKITDTAVSSVTDQSDSVFTISSGDIWGDVNDDYIVDINDALQIATYDIDPENPALDSILTIINQRGNVNADSFINITDGLICGSYELYPGNPNLPPRVGNPLGAVPKDTIHNEIHSDTYAIPIMSVNPGDNGYYIINSSVGTRNSDVFIGAASILVKWNPRTYQYVCIEDMQDNTVTNCKKVSDGELRMARFDVNGDTRLNFPIIKLKKISYNEPDYFSLEIFSVAEAVTFKEIPLHNDVVVNVNELSEKPQELELHQNTPNPFNSSTVIYYIVAHPTHIKLVIYNIQGQIIRTLINRFETSGIHTVIWDATDNEGMTIGSGVYFYQLSTPDYKTRKQMLLLR